MREKSPEPECRTPALSTKLLGKMGADDFSSLFYHHLAVFAVEGESETAPVVEEVKRRVADSGRECRVGCGQTGKHR